MYVQKQQCQTAGVKTATAAAVQQYLYLLRMKTPNIPVLLYRSSSTVYLTECTRDIISTSTRFSLSLYSADKDQARRAGYIYILGTERTQSLSI